MSARTERVRAVRIGFLVLLGVAIAQVLWWELDQVRYSSRIARERVHGYETDLEAARELLRLGAPVASVVERWPHLEVVADEGDPDVRVRARALLLVHEERRRHVRQYLWEGGFFLLVLLAGMSLVSRGLRQEAELRQRQQNFLAAVSHELKSPIASIQLSMETLAHRSLAEERRAELLARGLDDVRRLERMVSNLLEVPRLEAGQIELQPTEVPVLETALNVLEELRRAGYERASEVALQIPEELSVVADPESVQSVLRNLLENALKATSEGGAVQLSAILEPGRVGVRVTDSGAGFRPEEGRRLFEKFYRPGDEMRRRTKGTGLGLYLVRQLVELEGGGVRAESAGPGRGAMFEAWWPRRERRTDR